MRSPRARSSPTKRLGVLLHGHGFARERRFVHLQIGRLDQPRVGRHLVARVQQNEVSWHELARRNVDLLTVADHRDRGRGHSPQCFDRAFRSVLLYEAQHHSEQHDHGDGDGLDAVSDKGGDCSRDQQDDDQDILQLSQQNGPRRDTMSGLQLVRAISSESTLNFDFGQALRGGVKMRHDRIDR